MTTYFFCVWISTLFLGFGTTCGVSTAFFYAWCLTGFLILSNYSDERNCRRGKQQSDLLRQQVDQWQLRYRRLYNDNCRLTKKLADQTEELEGFVAYWRREHLVGRRPGLTEAEKRQCQRVFMPGEKLPSDVSGETIRVFGKLPPTPLQKFLYVVSSRPGYRE